MEQHSIGKRIQLLREHFKLSRKEFIEITGSSPATISRLEGDSAEPSDAFLNVLKERFAANPDWILTGEGEMLIVAEQYIGIGIELLGAEKLSAGFLKILKDPRFAEFQAFIKADSLHREESDDELRELLHQVAKLWQQGDERTRRILAQLVKAVGEDEGIEGSLNH